MQKPAETQYEIHDLLKNRWSPRAFSRQSVEHEKLLSLFEAARWSPSAGNKQPWSFIVITHADDETHQKLVEIMTGRNPLWAHNAPVLVLTVAQLNPQMPAFDRFAYFDLGQAVAHLTVEAAALGLDVHQMGGYDADKARRLFDIPEGYQPMSLIAIGYPGKLDDLHEQLREQEVAPRTRKPLTEFVFGEHWNQPLAVAASEYAVGD